MFQITVTEKDVFSFRESKHIAQDISQALYNLMEITGQNSMEDLWGIYLKGIVLINRNIMAYEY